MEWFLKNKISSSVDINKIKNFSENHRKNFLENATCNPRERKFFSRLNLQWIWRLKRLAFITISENLTTLLHFYWNISDLDDENLRNRNNVINKKQSCTLVLVLLYLRRIKVYFSRNENCKNKKTGKHTVQRISRFVLLIKISDAIVWSNQKILENSRSSFPRNIINDESVQTEIEKRK